MGTTGLETAFAASTPTSSLPGVLPLALVVEKLNAGAALFDLETPRIEVGRPADLTPRRPRRRVDRRRGAATRAARRTAASPGRTLHGPRPADHRRRLGGLPPARVRAERRVSVLRRATERRRSSSSTSRRAFRKAIPDFEDVARKTATLVEGARILGVPVDRHRAVPEGPRPHGRRGRARRRAGAREDGVRAPRRPTASTSTGATRRRLRDRGARLRAPDRRGPARRRASRCTSCADAIASRDPANKAIALERAERAGAVPTTVGDGAARAVRPRRAPTSSRQVQRLIK